MSKQLYRPRKNRVIAGVCSGFAEYFGIDAVIVRIVTVIIMLSGTGILAYIIAAVIMPSEESVCCNDNWKSEADRSTEDFIHEHEKERDEWAKPPKYNSEKNKLVIGAILIGLGILFLLKQFMPDFDPKYLVPLLLIGIGGVIVFKGRR